MVGLVYVGGWFVVAAALLEGNALAFLVGAGILGYACAGMLMPGREWRDGADG